jgi:hypothetical protein
MANVLHSDHGMRAAVVLPGILLTVLAMGFVSATAPIATHATKGVVKSVDATTLVITRSAVNRREMAFVLNPSTQREGFVTVGCAVEVRYRTEREERVATAIRVQERR